MIGAVGAVHTVYDQRTAAGGGQRHAGRYDPAVNGQRHAFGNRKSDIQIS